MSRVTSGPTTHARHKKVLNAAKGYYGRRSTTFKPRPKPSIRPTNTQPATARTASAISARFGSSGSMPRCAPMTRR